MMSIKILWRLFLVIGISSCTTYKNYNPNKKFAPQQLQSDYAIFRAALETAHPSLYWYTPKDSMDFYFNLGNSMLQDSLTEIKFRNVLSYVISKIRCGHTSVRPSKNATAYFQKVRIKSFPLGLKVWPDTAVVVTTFSRRDSLIKRNSIITGVDNRPMPVIIDSFFQHLSADGYNTTHKYQSLSNRDAFPVLYNSIFGLRQKYLISFIDTLGVYKTVYTDLYNPSADIARSNRKNDVKLSHRKKKLLAEGAIRSFKIDSVLHTGFMDLNTFVQGHKLSRFFKASFKKLKESGAQNLVIDLRGNGGGSVTNSTLLSKYLAGKPFKIADSLYAITRKGKYSQYQQHHLWNRLFMSFIAHRKEDGYYHFSYYERHYFKPKVRNHFDGSVYILTGGNTFSASILFIQAIKQQKNVTVVGEETGGGAYGNTAWLIPDVTLPHTKVRFRLPLFRLVINKDAPKTGHGIMPDVEVAPTVKSIRSNRDFKMDKVMQLIKKSIQ